MNHKDQILRAIVARGLSERKVSLEVFGHDTAIRDFKRSGSMSSSRLQQLCKYLDLEFYVGPPRTMENQAGPSRAEMVDAVTSAIDVIYYTTTTATMPAMTSQKTKPNEPSLDELLDMAKQVRQEMDDGGRGYDIEEALKLVIERAVQDNKDV